ncbi:hypothetical protein [Desulfonatronovibrio magnus]|uniref:hypothetical protein n=1 Tax=Desulfonatronovibrio magnus TaxID=698827 RepID=UPI0005EBC594|nr:hypothetical protein [Desulfonatronovibrio magnus]
MPDLNISKSEQIAAFGLHLENCALGRNDLHCPFLYTPGHPRMAMSISLCDLRIKDHPKDMPLEFFLQKTWLQKHLNPSAGTICKDNAETLKQGIKS